MIIAPVESRDATSSQTHLIGTPGAERLWTANAGLPLSTKQGFPGLPCGCLTRLSTAACTPASAMFEPASSQLQP
jgi:hypothetical protein